MIMNMSIEKMLSHVYEIEGLMLVTRRLGDENTPDVITNKIQRKVRELAEMCGVTLEAQPADKTPAEPAEEAPAEPVAEAPVEPTAPVAAEHLPEDDYDADETWQHDNGEEFKEVFSLNYKEPEHETVDADEVPVADREPDEDITLEWIEEEDSEHDEAEGEKPAAVPTPPAFNPTVAPPAFNPAPEQVVEEPAPPMINDEPVPEPDPQLVPEA